MCFASSLVEQQRREQTLDLLEARAVSVLCHRPDEYDVRGDRRHSLTLTQTSLLSTRHRLDP
jgi:hypothetical protein